VSPTFAYNKVMNGKWRECFDDFGNFYGVQVVAAGRCDMDLISDEDSVTTITAAESKQNAGLDGPSRTFGRSEDFRISRRQPEDWIERAQVKVQQWPFPASRIDNGRGPVRFGDRAIRVYPPTRITPRLLS
jgi:hypothetical protein